MALNYFDDRNKIESTILKTRYTSEEVSIPGSSATGWRLYKRVRTKTYRYVGMSKDTARQCLNAKIALYRRKYGTWKISKPYGVPTWVYDLNDYYYDHVAGVQASHQDGDLWDVEIQVDETCLLYYQSAEEIPNPEAQFEYYYGSNVWKYDEDGDSNL